MLIKEAIDRAVVILTKNDNSIFGRFFNRNKDNRKEIVKDVEDILMSVLKIKKAQLIMQYKQELPSVYENIFFSNVNDRKEGKPLAYITRNANFYNYDFFVNESCLIPRVDSEVLVERAEEYIVNAIKNFANAKNDKEDIEKSDEDHSKHNYTIKIIDVCCGSGCLGVSLVRSLFEKQERDKKKDINYNLLIELTLLDISSSAIKVAQLNAQNLLSKYVDNIKIKYIVSDVLQNGIGNDTYDMILCNPPYIETKMISTLEKQIKDYEPYSALDGGEDGLKFYRAFKQILQIQKQKHLNISYNNNNNNISLFSKAITFFEIGFNQSKSVCKMFNNIGFETILFKDFGEQDRVIMVRQKD